MINCAGGFLKCCCLFVGLLLVLRLWILRLGLLGILPVVFVLSLGLMSLIFYREVVEQVMRGQESCLLGVLSVELPIRHWSLLLALRLFLVMAVGGFFKVVRL